MVKAHGFIPRIQRGPQFHSAFSTKANSFIPPFGEAPKLVFVCGMTFLLQLSVALKGRYFKNTKYVHNWTLDQQGKNRLFSSGFSALSDNTQNELQIRNVSAITFIFGNNIG
jgi:hypothetical protein